MENQTGDQSRPYVSTRKTGRAAVVGRALRSTLVIAVVAVLVAAVRGGDLRWAMMVRLAWAHRGEFAMILMALVVWESWVARAKRRGYGSS